MALRIPKEFRAREGAASIEQVGERWIVEPIKPGGWPAGFFKRIRIADPTLTRPDQGTHRSFEA